MIWIMIFGILFSFIGGLYCGGRIVAINVNVSLKQLSKLRQMNSIYEDWIKYENTGNSLINYFRHNGYNSIVIYGGTAIAECLVGRLQDEISILAVMDRDDSLDFGVIPTLKPGAAPAGAQCIVVTTIGQFQNIKSDLEKSNNIPMIYIEDILKF